MRKKRTKTDEQEDRAQRFETALRDAGMLVEDWRDWFSRYRPPEPMPDNSGGRE